jgi:hypothetical protein
MMAMFMKILVEKPTPRMVRMYKYPHASSLENTEDENMAKRRGGEGDGRGGYSGVGDGVSRWTLSWREASGGWVTLCLNLSENRLATQQQQSTAFTWWWSSHISSKTHL